PARRKLAQPFEVRLHAPVTPQPLPALHRLLSLAASEGTLPLRLAPSPEAARLRELAEHELGALSRDGTRLTVTPFGQELLESPLAGWDALAALLPTASGALERSAPEAALRVPADGVRIAPA